MRIAQVAPLHESVPPQQYGGTERVVSYLTEELVRQGHDVTLFASGDSVTTARLIAPCDRSIRLNPDAKDPVCPHMAMLDQVFELAQEFDIIHFHTDYLHFPTLRWRIVPHVTTLHGRMDMAELGSLFRRFTHEPLVSISDSQREPLPWANWVSTVYHGLPDHHVPSLEHGRYLVFLGRISREKRLDRAIEIARRAQCTLKIAAKIDPADRKYFNEIRPLLRTPGVEFMGEIGERDKGPLLRGALALLFPIDWPEPFGLVMIEALACGTPVIAWPCGSVPEIIRHNHTGFLCRDIDDAVAAVERLTTLSRADCRREFESRFSSAAMARGYIAVYKKILGELEIDEAVPHGRHTGSGSVLYSGDVVADR